MAHRQKKEIASNVLPLPTKDAKLNHTYQNCVISAGLHIEDNLEQHSIASL